jgi:hypothetical protein
MSIRSGELVSARLKPCPDKKQPLIAIYFTGRQWHVQTEGKLGGSSIRPKVIKDIGIGSWPKLLWPCVRAGLQASRNQALKG